MNFPADVEKRIADWYRDSANKDSAIEDMLEVYGCTRTDLHRVLDKASKSKGLSPSESKSWTMSETKRLVELYCNDASADEISEELKHSTDEIIEKLQSLRDDGTLKGMIESAKAKREEKESVAEHLKDIVSVFECEGLHNISVSKVPCDVDGTIYLVDLSVTRVKAGAPIG